MAALTADAQLRQLARLKDDFPYYAETCLKIKAKNRQLMPLILNKAQLFAHRLIEEQRARTGKVRALILKGRQQGFSTYVGGRFYHRTSLSTGTNTYILTHEQAATDTLFAMVGRYHENTPLRPHTAAANAKELNFDKLDGGYAVGTAGSKAVGRSKTIHLFHGSEVGFWPNARDHFAGIMQTIPDLPGTEIILESTANGIGNLFHEEWQKAEAGTSDFIAIFVPWFWSDEYRRPVPEDFQLSHAPGPDGDPSEAEYMQQHNLELSQMVWRRFKIGELGHTLFKQEYPATAAEAFQVTGHESFIKPGLVMRARKAQLEAVGPLVGGADPARFGKDRFSIVLRQGRKMVFKESKTKLDTVAGAIWCKQIIDKYRPKKFFIDLGGQGAGVYDLLVSWGEPYIDIVVGVNFGGDPMEPVIILEDGSERPGPKNRRAEMWLRSRDWLEDKGGADIFDEDSLQADACGPGYKYDTNQRLVLESKEQMEKRGVRSPDDWDALALTFAEPVYDTAPGRAVASTTASQTRRAMRRPSGWMAA